jgi:F-type H+-transporting ATPase subunit b
MESIIGTFHIDWKIIIAQALNFGIVFVVLYIFALKPLSKMMEERSKTIAKGIDDAKTNESLLKKAEEEYDSALSKARIEANKIFQDSKKEAEDARLAMMEKTKEEVSTLIMNGKKVLESEKVKMVEEAKKEIVVLAVSVAEKILERKLDGTFDEKTVRELNNL